MLVTADLLLGLGATSDPATKVAVYDMVCRNSVAVMNVPFDADLT